MKQDEITVTTDSGLNRRDFLKLGSGLVVYFSLGPLPTFATGTPMSATELPGANPLQPMPKGVNFNSFLQISPDGRVTCKVGKVDLGQGLRAAMAQHVADELDVSFDSVDMIMGDTDLCPWDVGTFGSGANRLLSVVVRGAAAEGRAVLLQMAAERFAAPATGVAAVSLESIKPVLARLQVKEGVITDPATGKTVSYGELLQGKSIERKMEKVPLKPVTSYKVIGTSARRKDAAEIVTGQAKYTADFVLPDMVFARILRPPAHGSKLTSIDTSTAEKLPGVKVIKDGDMTAVVADRPDKAAEALELIKAQFSPSPSTLDDKSIFDYLVKTRVAEKVVYEGGNIAEGAKLGEVFERSYLHSYGAHAHMETHTTLAKVENGKATLWASTQRPFGVRDAVAQALGFKPTDVRVITPHVGGGFGGKNYVQNNIEAARIAKLVGKPVQLVWNRAEDIMYDRFRPAAVIQVRSAMNKSGQIVMWDLKAIASGDWGSVSFYDVPNHRTTAAPITEIAWRRGNNADIHPFNVGAWRMPGTSSTSFARESQMDVMAAKARMDPLQFRMKHLSDKRMIGVLEACAKQFGWKAKPAPSGRGVGVACGSIYRTYVATMAQVEVNKKTGAVQVKRVVTAVDPGTIVNPEGARQQVEGCITMGVGYALSEEVLFKNGEVLSRNFDSYEIPRFSAMPKMEVVLVDNRQFPPDGLGEPPIITMGAVIANAIYDATGARMLQLPMTPERVKAALKRS